MYYRKYLFKDYTKILNKLAMSDGVFEVNCVFFHEQNQIVKIESKRTTMSRLDVFKIDNVGISNKFGIDEIIPNGYQDASFYVNSTDANYYYSMLTKLLYNFTPLRKFRYKPIPDQEFAVEYVDIYPDLALMVYEFTTETIRDEFVTPSFCGKEVTNDKEYDEYYLYKKLVNKTRVLTIAGKDLTLTTEPVEFDVNIIQTKDDILTKDLEECNEKSVLFGDVTAKRTIKAGEPIYPSDFKLEYNNESSKFDRTVTASFNSHLTRKKRGRPKGSTNKKRKGYAWIDMKGMIH